MGVAVTAHQPQPASARYSASTRKRFFSESSMSRLIMRSRPRARAYTREQTRVLIARMARDTSTDGRARSGRRRAGRASPAEIRWARQSIPSGAIDDPLHVWDGERREGDHRRDRGRCMERETGCGASALLLADRAATVSRRLGAVVSLTLAAGHASHRRRGPATADGPHRPAGEQGHDEHHSDLSRTGPPREHRVDYARRRERGSNQYGVNRNSRRHWRTVPLLPPCGRFQMRRRVHAGLDRPHASAPTMCGRLS